MTHSATTQSNCPLARSMEILGEGWTLLVLREAFLGTRQFKDFERELGLARNILSARLKKLVEFGLLDRLPSQTDRRVVEYRLSRAGLALFPALVALSQWGGRWLCGAGSPVRFIERANGADIAPVEVRAVDGRVLGIEDVAMVAGPDADQALAERYERAAASAA